MGKIISSVQDIITDVLIYSPVLSLFMLPITRARNLPKSEDRVREEDFRTQGRELYQLAQDLYNLNAGAQGLPPDQTLHVNTVTQAAVAGLYLTHTLAPQLENSLRAGNEIKNQFTKDTFAYPPPLPFLTDNYLPNEEPNDILPIDNYPKAPLNVLFLPDHTLRLKNGAPLFASPNLQNPTSVSPPLPPAFSTLSPFPLIPNAAAWGNATQPENVLKIPPRKPFPKTKNPFDKKHRAKKFPSASTLKKSLNKKWLTNNEVDPEQYYAGRIDERAEVQLTAVQEQIASKSQKPQAKEVISEPDGNVPEPPVLEDFIEPDETILQAQPVESGNVPAPTMVEKVGEPALVQDPEEIVAPNVVPDSLPPAPLPENDNTAPVLPAAENIDGSLAGPASYLLSQVSELASQLMKKTVQGATVGGGTALATGGAAVIEGAAAVASGGLGVLGGGTAVATGSAATAGGSATLKISGDAAASGSLAMLTAVGINRAARQEADAVDAIPAVVGSPLPPPAQPNQGANRVSTPKPKEQDNVQPARAAESMPALTFADDIAELPAVAPNEHIFPPVVAPAPEEISAPEVEVKPDTADRPIMKPAQVVEAVEIARPAERVKSRPARPREKTPQSRTPLAKPGEVVVQDDVHAPRVTPEKTVPGERETRPPIHPVPIEAERSPLPAAVPAREDIALPDVKVKPGKAHSPVIQPAQIVEAVEIARPAERVKSRPARPREKTPQSRTPLANSGEVEVDVNAPMATRGGTGVGEREASPLMRPASSAAERSPEAVAEPVVSPAQKTVQPAEASAGLSITPWPVSSLLSTEAIINQCKIRLAAHEEGVLKKYIDSDYYGHVPIYEVVDKNAAFWQPVYRHYIEMNGEKVAVKLSSVKGHGIKYTLIDENKPDVQYGLAFDDGRWQLQPPTAEEIDPSLLAVMTFNMVDPDISEEMLSAPDERGVQWIRDQEGYLCVNGFYANIYAWQDYFNFYHIQPPRNQLMKHGIAIRYKDGRFIQQDPRQNFYKKGLQKWFDDMRRRINTLLTDAEQDLDKNRMVKGARRMCLAFRGHKMSDAGSMHRITRLALKFIQKYVFNNENIDLATVDAITIQEAWVKNIRLLLKNDIKEKEENLIAFFNEIPKFYKDILVFIIKPSVKNSVEKFALALDGLSTTPLPLYSVNQKTVLYNLEIDETTASKIAIMGNDVFIKSVIGVLNEIKQTWLGRKLLLALQEQPFTIQPPTMSAIERVADGRFYARNSAGGAIAFDPGNFIIGDGKTIMTEPWRYRNPAIALYHELLHLYYKTYPVWFESVDETSKKICVGAYSPLEEALITGISYKDPKTQKIYDFANDEYLVIKNKLERISENHFREEYAKMKRYDHYFIRPYYGGDNAMDPPIDIKFTLSYS
ncbi:hypothetical protein [Sodalis sp. RH16]|uniref:hypothetical protein n=1 Tax=Sodalis sp. RH16 TaxID=3394331 RepID=UPI0039B3698C